MWREGPAIGIDLGTTYSRVAVYQKGRVTIIENEEGNKTTASCVAFTDTERLIGDEAKTRVVLNPQNTIFDSKRMIGRNLDDPKIQQDIENWQFNAVKKCGRLMICVELEREIDIFTPEEISAMVLTEMKEKVESYLGKKVIDAVISVPACFNDSQRQATKNAARIAGLNVIRLITEPTATILAYMVQKTLKGVKNVLIYDLGGGTLDVSIITIDDDWKLEVKSTAGDSHLGGENFDNVLVAHFVEEFKTKHQRDLRTCPKALRRLIIECEYAKRTLTSCFEVRIYINCLFEGINLHSKLTRAQFEDMCMDLFRSTLKPVKRALFDAQMAKGIIDEVVLVGGSSRIPKIRELIKDFFDGKEPFVSINPDEAVAYGAAVQAAALTGRTDEKTSFRLVEVSPFSFLLKTKEGVMTTLIHRNSQIPCDASKIYSTEVENQTIIKIDVYEGEQATAKDNRLMGRFTIEGIPPGPKGAFQGELRFQLDSNGILNVNAESSETQITITVDKDGLSIYEVDFLIDYSSRRHSMELYKRDRNAARKKFISYVYSIKLMIEYSSDDCLSAEERDMAIRICESFLDWMNENSLAEPVAILDEIDLAKVELAEFILKMEQERLR